MAKAWKDIEASVVSEVSNVFPEKKDIGCDFVINIVSNYWKSCLTFAFDNMEELYELTATFQDSCTYAQEIYHVESFK